MKTGEQPWQKRRSSALQTCFEDIFELVVIYVISLLLYGFLVLLINFFWLTYSETMVGHRFIQMQGGAIPGLITVLTNVHIVSFSLHVNTTALIVAVLIATVSKFLHLKYFFYDPAGFILRVVLWGGFYTLVTARILSQHFALHFVDLLKVAVLPCLFFLTASFDFSSRAIPSIVTLVMLARR